MERFHRLQTLVQRFFKLKNIPSPRLWILKYFNVFYRKTRSNFYSQLEFLRKLVKLTYLYSRILYRIHTKEKKPNGEWYFIQTKLKMMSLFIWSWYPQNLWIHIEVLSSQFLISKAGTRMNKKLKLANAI